MFLKPCAKSFPLEKQSFFDKEISQNCNILSSQHITDMKQILYRLFEHQYLGREEARNILQNIAEGRYNDSPDRQSDHRIPDAQYLRRGIDRIPEAFAGDACTGRFKRIQADRYRRYRRRRENTFNISTCSCFVVAGAGYNVVKHGNYGATSVSGASNVMEQHGVKFTNDIDKLRTSMDTRHIAYLHAPLFNPALKAVAPVRKSLGVRSFFNMLGPLVNPVMPTYQLLGVYNLPLLRLYNYTYQESGTRFAVVHSFDGYDEISLTADFKVAMPEKEKLYTPEMLGFKRCTEADLDGGGDPGGSGPYLRRRIREQGYRGPKELRDRQLRLRHPR